MKFNFWQILGGILLLVGIVWIIVREASSTGENKPAPTTQATTR